MPSNTPEAQVKKLSRLPANTVCANCGKKKDFGFSSVCIKYRTFVCDFCKSSHAAVSHRCKSLTMSTWTKEEVDSLKEENGGGNNVCRRTWLGNAPAIGERYNGGKRPKEGDQLDIFKAFVIDVYERRKFLVEGGVGGSTPQQVQQMQVQQTQAQQQQPQMNLFGSNGGGNANNNMSITWNANGFTNNNFPSATSSPVQAPAQTTPVPAPPAADLLNFDAPPPPLNKLNNHTLAILTVSRISTMALLGLVVGRAVLAL